ncbi:MAG: hypothetical protein PHE49_09665 [bacterium]|nr:hypothetical protein [bacterium]
MWIKKYLIPFFIFCVLTGVMTYPLILKMGNSVTVSVREPLFQAWDLAWCQHKIMTGFHGFWNANMFYPENHTLTYSERLLGIGLIALPARLFSNNPIFIYNFAVFLSFVLSGFGVYLLVLYLTKNKYAGYLSAIIFMFSHFRFAHINHLNLLSGYWIPLVFLYLHKFFEDYSYKNLFLCVLFFIIQSLSCVYYALFLFIVTVFATGIFLFSKKRYKNELLWKKLILAFIVIMISILPFFYPYLKAANELGYSRSIYEAEFNSADVLSYIFPHWNSVVYGNIFTTMKDILGGATGEKVLFPGLIAIFLAILSFRIRGVLNKTDYNLKISRLGKWAVLGFNLALFVVIGYSLYILIGGYGMFSYSLRKPIIFIVLLIIIRLIIDKQWRLKWANFFSSMPENQRLYLFIGILGFLLSLGPSIFFAGKKIWYWWTPYSFLYDFCPGFKGLRASARIGIMTMLSISVLAGYGANRIQTLKIKSQKGMKYFYLALCSFVLVECFCAPLEFCKIPVGKEIPQVYNWLAKEKGDSPVMELPMSEWPRLYDITYLYYSTYHWKKLVNGYGIFPRGYTITRLKMRQFPSLRTVEFLKKLQITYVLIHKEEFLKTYRKEQIKWDEIDKELQLYKDKIFLVKDFGDDIVYRVNYDK